MGPRLGRVEYGGWLSVCSSWPRFNGATLRTRGIRTGLLAASMVQSCFNGATLRTRGIRYSAGMLDNNGNSFNGATLRTRGIPGRGDRLIRVFYSFNGATLRTRGILRLDWFFSPRFQTASMGPRLGRVEYVSADITAAEFIPRFNGATLRTRGIRSVRRSAPASIESFNGATLRTRGIPQQTIGRIAKRAWLQWGHA